MKISNKGFGINTITCFFAFILLVFAIVFSIGFITGIAKQEEKGAQDVTQHLIHMAMLNRILTSKDCLSTGEMGILNKTLLDEKKSDIECAKMYTVDFDLSIKSIKSPHENWKFEYSLGKEEPKESIINPFSWIFGKKRKPGIQTTIPVIVRSSSRDEIAILTLRTYYHPPSKGTTVVLS